MASIQQNTVTATLSSLRALEDMATCAQLQQRLLAGSSRRDMSGEERVSAGIDAVRENKYYLDALAPMVKVADMAELPSQPMVVSAHPVNPKGIAGFAWRAGYDTKAAGRAFLAKARDAWEVGVICARTGAEVCVEGAKVCVQNAERWVQGAARTAMVTLWSAAQACAGAMQRAWRGLDDARVGATPPVAAQADGRVKPQQKEVAGADVQRPARADDFSAYMRRRAVAED